MCLSFCHVKRWVYMNHADCHPVMCEWAWQQHASCQSCGHWRSGICSLTGASTHSASSGQTEASCCHHNAELVTGMILIDEVWLPDEGGAYRVPAQAELDWAGIAYEVAEDGVLLDVADCIPPLERYGVGGVC